ncbi:di- and tricarboxylate transporter [Longilinea arvoryzae]|uniref:Di-and tricarboxylate transporter n=1 Tax=Longilinea arvoryzae TaxID=360412 RepID=A0A0S7BHG7_9CHLR|nr:SLC13 family permease [Longilinea arvoryzae]GAP12938.1 di- and tricarboxylate transporter [Longilinea arvoryzae]
MNLNQWLLIAIIVLPLLLVILNRLRIDLAALSMAVALGALQLLGLGMLGPAHTPAGAIQAISGLSQPVVITLISLFILTRGLEKSGLTAWLAHQIVRISNHHESRLIALFAALTALLSLFMNNLAAGALVLPSAMEASRKTGIRPSKLLIPVAYGSLLGGAATYFTTANIIMSDLLRIANPPQQPLGILDFTPTGGLIAAAGILFLAVFGSRLLPDREPSAPQSAPRLTGSELEALYQIGERLWEARVLPGSAFANRPLYESSIGGRFGVAVAAVRGGADSPREPTANPLIRPGNILYLIGREERIAPLNEMGLEITPLAGDTSVLRGISYLEIMLAPHSRLEGQTLKQLDFRQQFGVPVIALKRLTRSYRTDVGDIPLQMGDSLLAVGRLREAPALQRSPDLIVLQPDPAGQPVDRRQAGLTLLLIAAAVGISLAGAPIYLVMLAAAVLALLLRILPPEEAYQSVEWPAVFLIAGMYAVSLAMVQTGLAELLGQRMLELVTPFGPLGVAAGAYLLTALLTQFMGGQVSALVTGPITISAAISMGANPQAVAVATAIGCSASFLTPMAHPVNILMIAPANYKFSDFFRIGWPLTLISFAGLLAGLALFWGL